MIDKDLLISLIDEILGDVDSVKSTRSIKNIHEHIDSVEQTAKIIRDILTDNT